ncbi:hypothetical protein DOY81_011350 [Sarcophaga bullata]|nr:hypothetical protein DOY81_011350 [Sarcophaga bullata]
MGKKGKGNKLAKMSEEERARYLQLRADIEEETRRRKMQLISMYMKNKLKREEAFCRLNMAKINQEWRSILRQIKCQEQRQEIIEMAKYCKDMMDHKDNVIRRLLNDLEVAHNQHDTMSQTHMEMVQHFINIQQQRLEFFRENYDSEKQLMLQQFHKDHQAMNELRNKAQEQLECVHYQLEEKNDKEKNDEYEKFLENIETITQKGEEKLEQLWRDYQQAYPIINQLANLKLIVADAEDKSEILKEHLTQKLNELKEKVAHEMQENEEKFKLASVESYKAVKTLNEKGQTILQLANVCRKFVTEKEKILTLGLTATNETNVLKIWNRSQQYREVFENQEKVRMLSVNPVLGVNGFVSRGFANWFLMENFWKRVNNVKIDVVCLTQRKKSLEQENLRLKAELQERLINLNYKPWHQCPCQ